MFLFKIFDLASKGLKRIDSSFADLHREIDKLPTETKNEVLASMLSGRHF